MAHEHLIGPIRERLKSNQSTRKRRALVLEEMEGELASLRDEIAALDRMISMDKAEIDRILTESFENNHRIARPSDDELEAAIRRDAAAGANNPAGPGSVYPMPGVGYESAGDRFADRTIPQAPAMILRECGTALHVNDIYQHLLDGGFKFTGHNPTISIAVSLNRNRRFRKTAPGTFDLMMRDVAHAK